MTIEGIKIVPAPMLAQFEGETLQRVFNSMTPEESEEFVGLVLNVDVLQSAGKDTEAAGALDRLQQLIKRKLS